MSRRGRSLSMDWYYAIGAERKGPLNEQEFQQLIQQGVITAETLVWREGFSDWQPLGARATPSTGGHAPRVNVTCAGCGGSFLPSEVISLGKGLYCATCKPLALQRLKEGVDPNTTGAAEEIRKKHLSHEAAVQSIGSLYYLGGIAVVCLGAF